MIANRLRHISRLPGLVATLAALVPIAGQAADLPASATAPYLPPPLPAFTWTGVYGGVNVGGGFSTGNAFNGYLGSTGNKARGVLGGLQLGYNYQVSPMFVVGIENDFSASNISTSGNDVRLPFLGTGRARAGIALLNSQLLVYGTAGAAFGQIRDSGVSALRFGWTAGGGVEYALSQRWSVKVEGLYTDLFKGSDADVFAGRHAKFVSGKIGVNYHFDLLRPGQIADRY